MAPTTDGDKKTAPPPKQPLKTKMPVCYYEVLGIVKAADEQEIKKA